jgi:hypothetical protein
MIAADGVDIAERHVLCWSAPYVAPVAAARALSIEFFTQQEEAKWHTIQTSNEL